MKIRIERSNAIIIILTTLLLIVCLFQISFLKYIDELLAVYSIYYIIYRFSRGEKIDRIIKVSIIFIITILIIGILSNILYHYQYNWKLVMEDIFLFFKPYVIFLSVYMFFNRGKKIQNFHFFMIQIAKILTGIIFVGLVISMIFDIPDLAFYSPWATIKSVKIFVFFTGSPGYLAIFLGILIAILLVESDKKSIRKYIFMNILSVLFTQSGIGYIAVFLLFVFAVVQQGKKIKWYHICLLAVGGIVVGWNEIKLYLLTDTAARSIMLKNGLMTAKNLFPLGSGFSTYGGTVAAQQYAKLYYEYNFNNYWGMEINRNVDFLHDFYYPIIIGQFGVFGTALYIWYEYSIFSCINSLKCKREYRCALLFSLILLLVVNLGQGEFGGPIGSIYMIVIPLLLKEAGILGDREKIIG